MKITKDGLNYTVETKEVTFDRVTANVVNVGPVSLSVRQRQTQMAAAQTN